MFKTLILALIAALCPSLATAQTFPTVPDHSVIGRIGTGSGSGPSQAILFANLTTQLLAALNTPNGVAITNSLGVLGIVGTLPAVNMPAPTASTLGGIESITCGSNTWLSSVSTLGVPGCTQPAFSNLSGTTNAVANSSLAQAGAATIKGNPTGSTANEQDFTIQGLTARGAPDATNDKILIYDNASGTFKYVTPGQVAAAATSGVSSWGGQTGALAASPANHSVVVDVGGAFTWKAIPDCQDSSGNHINYTQSSDAFSCGTTVPTVTGNNLVRNAGLGLTTQVSTVMVGVPGSGPAFTVPAVTITGWAQQGGAGSGNVRFTTSGGNGGLQPGKLVAIMGQNTTIALAATVTGGNTITATGAIFTQAAGDLLWITGGSNHSARTQFRVVSVSGCTSSCTTAVVNGGLVNESGVTFYMTGIQGGYAVDATVNGMPQAGNPDAPAFFYYPLQITQVGTNFFDAQMAGHNLNVGATGSATAWEVTNGAQGTGCIGPDWWSCTSTISAYKMRGTDWNGSTVVNATGSLYSYKLVKGATTEEFFWQDLTATAPALVNIAPNYTGVTAFQGKALTCGAYLWAPNASQGRIFLYDGTTRTYSSYVTSGSLQWIEVSATMSSTASTAQFGSSQGSGSIGDTFFFTQPICKYGSGTIGAGNYLPAPPTFHMFTNHTNPFYYISQAVPANTYINIEQETSGALPSGFESVQADIGGANATVGAALQLSDSPGPPQMSALVNINPVNSATQTSNQTGVVAISKRASGDGQFILDYQWINVNGSATWTKVTVDYLGGIY